MTKQKMLLVKSDRSTVVADSTLSDKATEIFNSFELLGRQNFTATGPIDILAKSKTNNDYLVIELKKGRTSDSVVGQILRYVTWVKENLAKDGGTVRGAVVILESDQKLKYALRGLDNIALYNYEVNFRLNEEQK